MAVTRGSSRRGSCIAWLLLATALIAGSAHAALSILDTKYHPDLTFPEFDCYWDGGQYPTLCPTNYKGATVYVYLKNTGATAASITDATLAGYSLTTILKRSTASWNPNDLNSIFFYWDNPPADILAAGEPVWWKADPPTVPAGGVGQVAVRLRYVPTTPTVSVGVTSGGTATAEITVDPNSPQIQGIGYSEDRMKVFLHWRRGGWAAPVSVWLDGTNVTSLTTTVGDANLGFGASVINLTNPLAHFSFHVYQGVYGDGKTATAGQHAWTNKFIYSTYGTFDFSGGYDGHAWLEEASAHGFNNVQMNLGGMGSYMGTAAGRADMLAHGYGYTILDPGKLNAIDPDMWFLNDEPELTEYNNYKNGNCGTGYKIPCEEKRFAGTLAMFESVEHTAALRAERPNVPTTVNLDGGLQPQSFYNWGPSVDILQSDNYYEPREQIAYTTDANKIPLYNNSRFSYAIGRTICAAAEPNPCNHLLYSTAKSTWPYPAWQSKRFEVYYTLAGGTKGIGYWWLNGAYGMNNTDPTSQLLWREVGLCGNEIKTARDLIVRSTPIIVPITQTSKVWAKAVASGADSMILYVVNDNYLNDYNGCHVTNVPNAIVTVTLPAWMQSPLAFEITAGGLKPVISQLINGNQLQLSLGTLTLTRMIVLTTDPQVPLATLNRYNSVVRGNICSMAPEFCTNSAPAVVVPPQSRTVALGENAPFTVTASAVPLPTFQWRFNGGDLASATDATYTRANAQADHAGSYTVVIHNSLGSVTSAVAILTVSTNGIAPGIFTPPQSLTVNKGEDAAFSVTASGTLPLAYQWRFNGTNLSGANGSSFTRSATQTNDAGSYTVVVTNSAGTITSAPATLTVTVPVFCLPVYLVNGGFETTDGSGIAVGWTGYQRAPNPTTTWTLQTANPPEAGSTRYQQIANTSGTGGGGVRQDVTNCVIGATYRFDGWMRGNSTLYATCTVKVSPTASTNWATAVDLNPPQTYTGTNWVRFSGTVVATGPRMTLWLDGQTGSTGQNKAECFDSVTVTCLGTMAPPVLDAKVEGANLVFRWPTNYAGYSLIGTTNLGSAWTPVSPTPLVQGVTNVVTTTPTGERKFYRLTHP